MSRAGREPAEDVKRRLVTACQEVGLVIQNANMIRRPDDGSRVIVVGAIPAGWRLNTPVISLMATVSAGGDWSRTVDVRCVATDNDSHLTNAPVMQGRGAVPLGELVEQLVKTLAERQQVITAMNEGKQGPFEFEQSVWKTVDLLGDLDLFKHTE